MASSSSSHQTLVSSRGGSGILRRAVPPRAEEPSKNPVRGSPLHPDIDPPPKPWRVAQYLALGFIFFFTMLQFLPPTHFRNPSDPLRTWIPFNSDLSSTTVCLFFLSPDFSHPINKLILFSLQTSNGIDRKRKCVFFFFWELG